MLNKTFWCDQYDSKIWRRDLDPRKAKPYFQNSIRKRKYSFIHLVIKYFKEKQLNYWKSSKKNDYSRRRKPTIDKLSESTEIGMAKNANKCW